MCRSCRHRWGSCRPGIRTSTISPVCATVSSPSSIGRSRRLLDDLEVRGLLDETLVVMLGEFGRTPRISRLTPDAVPGRDHWPYVFPAVFAGAGVVGGQVIGKSDRLGAYPLSRSFGPPDLAATIYHALGVDPATELRDRLGRPHPALHRRGDRSALHDRAGLSLTGRPS